MGRAIRSRARSQAKGSMTCQSLMCTDGIVIAAAVAVVGCGILSCKTREQRATLISSSPPTITISAAEHVPSTPSTAPAQQGASDKRCPSGTVFVDGGRLNKKKEIQALCMDRTEVTVADYGECVAAAACSAADTNDLERGECNWNFGSGRQTHPINCVTHEMASRYCRWRRRRLPTSEEWCWAATGRDEGRRYPWGNQEPPEELCWSPHGLRKGSILRDHTCRVGAFPKDASRDGILDLAGNVVEWTASAAEIPGEFFSGGGFYSAISPIQVVVDGVSSGAVRLRSPLRGVRCVTRPGK